MHYRSVLLTFTLCFYWVGSDIEADSGDASDLGADLVSELRNDANLDLSVDEEYEDLRAELLAYHTALAAIATRRSLLSTPCWRLGGICVNYKLCAGARFLTEVPGCKNKHNVCCFAWNRLQVRDMRDKGISNLGLPWSLQYEVGGKGVVAPDEKEDQENGNAESRVNEESERNTRPGNKKMNSGKGSEHVAFIIPDAKMSDDINNEDSQ